MGDFFKFYGILTISERSLVSSKKFSRLFLNLLNSVQFFYAFSELFFWFFMAFSEYMNFIRLDELFHRIVYLTDVDLQLIIHLAWTWSFCFDILEAFVQEHFDVFLEGLMTLLLPPLYFDWRTQLALTIHFVTWLLDPLVRFEFYVWNSKLYFVLESKCQVA